MPTYEFGCDDCGIRRDVLVNRAEAETLELVCSSCGGTMHLLPVLSLNVVGRFVADSPVASPPVSAKSCGHTYHCRCHIRLSRPNPFRERIRAASGSDEGE